MKPMNLFLLITSVSFAQEFTASLTVNVSNLSNDNGQVVAFLFQSSDGFPMNSEKAMLIETLPIQNGVAIFTFNDLPYDNYALLIIHDEDMNQELNTNFIGKPTEKCWISNGQRGGPFGGPNFNASSFEIASEAVVLNAVFND